MTNNPSGQLYGTAHVGSGERWTTHIKQAGVGTYVRWVDGRTMLRTATGWRELRGIRKWAHWLRRWVSGKRS